MNREDDNYEHQEDIQNDAIIGKVFKGSLFLLIAILGVALVIWIYLRPEDQEEILIERSSAQLATTVQEPSSKLPDTPFRALTNLPEFEQFNGATGEKLLPETMGTGVAIFFYDEDDYPDLLFVNSAPWPHSSNSAKTPTQKLFRNVDGTRFIDITREAGLDQTFYGQGVAVGDVDNDGDSDLFFTAVGSNRLFLNENGVYKDVSKTWAVGGDPKAWSSGAGFFDMDNDGDLDLFVCQYVVWSREIDLVQNYTLNGTDRAYGPPTGFEGTHCSLYRNDGSHFTDISEEAGIHQFNPATGTPLGKALAVTFCDVDKDGLLDILVANDTVQNFLFQNLGNGQFMEVGVLAGIAFDGMGASTGAMGIDAGTVLDGDSLGISIANFANEATSLYAQQPVDPWLFSDVANQLGVGSPSRLHLSFGVFFFDMDLDGRFDLLQANGHLEEEINQVQPSQHYLQSAQLFVNQSSKDQILFVEMPDDQTGDLSVPIAGRAASYGDFDLDGDPDVALTQVSGPPRVLYNDQNSGNHWIGFRLQGTQSNRDAIGCRVDIKYDDGAQSASVMPTRSYLSQVDPRLRFGLGPRNRIESATIHWPSGQIQTLDALEINRYHRVVEPD